MKPSKPLKNAHTSNMKKGMGDHYGTGPRTKMGRMIEGNGMRPVTPKQIKKPPKSLA